MSTGWILTLLVSVAVLVDLVRTIRNDGYGHRPPPASHAGWSNGHLPSTPPALG